MSEVTLSDLRDAMAARRIVVVTLATTRADGLCQVSGRREGEGWTSASGPSFESALEDMLIATRHRHELPPVRYFRADGRLIVTYHGAPPLASEGPFEEIDVTEYLRLKATMLPPADDLDDLA